MRIRGEYEVIWRHREGADEFRHWVTAASPSSARRTSQSQIERILGENAKAWAGEQVVCGRRAPEWGSLGIALGFALWLSVLLLVMVRLCPSRYHIGPGTEFASSSLRDFLSR